MNNRIPLKKMLTFGLLPSSLKKALYRLHGNHIGKHVKLSWGSVIVCKEKFSIGDNSRIGHFTSICARTLQIGCGCNIRSAVIINADNIQIGNDVVISETAILRAGHLSEQSSLIIDDLVHIFPSTTIDPSRHVHLQEECAVGPGCSIFTHGSYKNILDGYPVHYGNVVIGKRVELTYNVFVAPGVTIGDDTIVAYGSYVNQDLPANVLAAGLPAVVKRQKEQFAPTPSEKEKKEILKDIIEEFHKHLSYNGIHFSEDQIQLIGTNEIIVKGNTRFDLQNRCCDKTEDTIAISLRRFLSRYGIRFKTLE